MFRPTPRFKPYLPYNVPANIYTATFSTVNGVPTKTYTLLQDIIFVSAKSYGGTEKVVNGKYVIEDTIEIETWYNPNITSDCRIKLLDDDSMYEIINTPEDIDRRHQYMKFKIRRLAGKA